ncbi:hypothetical protein [Carboxylicivirga sp. RSCT41]|uniref:hypothetical protein n=1 Tax=Carboxylicivirga agarovorans TaxID=3417570 RepID=UPI003D3581D0
MKKILIAIILGAVCYSCINPKENILNQDIFELIIKDRIRLNSTVQILQETNDSLGIFNITLIENSNIDVELDTTRNRLVFLGGQSIPLSHPFFMDSVDYIDHQLDHLKSSSWDTTSLGLKIEIDSPLEELGDSIKYKTLWWIDKYVKDKAFLQIGQPIFNVNGEALVATEIMIEDYVINKMYILNRVNDNWKIIDSNSSIGKFTPPEIKEKTNPDGTIARTETRYLIFLGNYDI